MITWGDPESGSLPLPSKLTTRKISARPFGPRLSVEPRRYAPRHSALWPLSQKHCTNTNFRLGRGLCPLPDLSPIRSRSHFSPPSTSASRSRTYCARLRPRRVLIVTFQYQYCNTLSVILPHHFALIQIRGISSCTLFSDRVTVPCVSLNGFDLLSCSEVYVLHFFVSNQSNNRL